ncbi:undecaprenyl-diphosphatase [Bosea sp. (in: a-proteobacteria)]|uniref:undecaprenyl-diphosphatase n=1 Tax=Bosea sp. (in: a-proteobacteria) TaxID=1871050 RepID=UPI001220CB5C|nr:undecaprenyl-diphosphatase [Bosea sp. (in: a-proteobacteria)]TAJ34101.1 MAG: undecaprenyl-diphosphatase [Bosea sp. (in: a-proteobacteria)]
MLETLNQNLFFVLNAGPSVSSAARLIGIAAAEYLFWLLPAVMVIAWIVGSSRMRHALLVGAIAAWIGLAFNQGLGLFWPHPRPFMLGLGQQLIPHQSDPSFPSDHLTVIWSVAASLLVGYGSARRLGLATVFLGLVIAWGRIFVGVHFPFDMVGSALVAVISSMLAWNVGARPSAWCVQLSRAIERRFRLHIEDVIAKMRHHA